MFDNVVLGFERHRINRFDLQRFHEAFGLGIVIWIASAYQGTGLTHRTSLYSLSVRRLLTLHRGNRWLSKSS